MIDVLVLMGGTSGEAIELPGLGRELLEGMDIDASPGFTAWLLGERRHLQGLSEAVLREGALQSLAAGNARAAVELATRFVAADPLNEDAHVLLVARSRPPVTPSRSNDSSPRRSICSVESSAWSRDRSWSRLARSRGALRHPASEPVAQRCKHSSSRAMRP